MIIARPGAPNSVLLAFPHHYWRACAFGETKSQGKACVDLMPFVNSPHVPVVALTALALMLGGVPMAQADIKDYEFTLIAKGIKKGDAIVSVRLIHKPDGKLVPGAVIFATRLDMAPDGMEMMTASIEPLPSAELGVYRFKLDLSMEGKWRVSLAAKVQGETGTLENRLVLKAAP